MYTNQSARNERRHRTKAAALTVVMSVCLFGALTFGGTTDWVSLVPDTVKEWVGMDKPAQTDEAVVVDEARP